MCFESCARYCCIGIDQLMTPSKTLDRHIRHGLWLNYNMELIDHET